MSKFEASLKEAINQQIEWEKTANHWREKYYEAIKNDPQVIKQEYDLEAIKDFVVDEVFSSQDNDGHSAAWFVIEAVKVLDRNGYLKGKEDDNR